MTYPLHPILVALWIWLALFAANSGEVTLADAMATGMVTAVVSIALLAVLWWLTRSRGSAGLAATLLIFCMAFYGYAFDAVDESMPARLNPVLFMSIWVVLFLVPLLVLLIRRPCLDNLTRVLNVSALVLVVLPLISLVIDKSREVSAGDVSSSSMEAELAPIDVIQQTAALPDIYFLIFDRYPDERTLKSVYRHDNSSFLNGLRQFGFYVVEGSRANYPRTAHSLASSLNMRHLSDLSASIGPRSFDWKPLHALIKDNRVAQFLNAIGYHYVHMGSNWNVTMRSPLADENFEVTVPSGSPVINAQLNEFEMRFVEPLLANHFINFFYDISSTKRAVKYERVQQKFAKLASLERGEAPLFVFAHFLLPHHPFVFFPDGSFKSTEAAKSVARNKNYVDQLRYTNDRIIELVKALQQKRPQPIIIVQSDEGPFPLRFLVAIQNRHIFDWRFATISEIRQKFRILNAIYFPDGDYKDLYSGLSPVNTFPIIFDRYFDTKIDLLKDESFCFISTEDIYSFFEVTELAR